MRLSGWGRYPVLDCRLARVGDPDALGRWLAEPGSLIARGAGRAYGDAALNPALTLDLQGLDRLRAFDPLTGRLTAEAGVRLETLLALFVPRGWFPPVVPGTKFVTLGGMAAADVHGKNHHQAGSFGDYVAALELALPDGRVVACSRQDNAALFQATLGGMGLTGVIRAVTLDLMPVETAWLHAEALPAPDLDAVLAGLDAAAAWPYSVAWIDALAGGGRHGRGLIYRGRHLRHDELSGVAARQPLATHRGGGPAVPDLVPAGAMARPLLRGFNALTYARGAGGGRTVAQVPYDRFFFPLDRLRHWNRLYGRRGFVQYQCALPAEASRAGLKALLDRVAGSGHGAFLAVLKRLGPGRPERPLSFPLAGDTLALDLPMRRGTRALLAELDAITADHGGRVYLAKDACTCPAHLARGYPHLDDFRCLRRELGAAGRLDSALSRRLEL